MQLESKALIGMVQPLSNVDQTLVQQGFRRIGNNNSPVYDATIYDSSTSMTYYLRIPTHFAPFQGEQSEPSVKIGSPYLKCKKAMRNSRDGLVIPRAIKAAAEHKLAEIADYLSRSSSSFAQ
ncbi:hypothetical protein [Brevibacillus daliensis]|uniref:hypothetical protein n=1 Tax=Brevibacillus daliensis TaxID=2892995 RepID=UPI001E2E9005|nr:hypothetical protein [Brevibacillus daliensis]